MKTKRLHRLSIASSILVLLIIASAGCLAQERPNVIIILTDDQGTVDAKCFGAKDLETPNIDALATRGVRFTQFYAAAAVCSPSRAGLLTGRYPLRTGLIGNAGSHEGGAGLPAKEITIAETLKASGYATAHFGKWHLGYRPATMPNGQGFDYSFGHMGGCIDNYSHFFYWAGPNVHDLHQNTNDVFYNGEFFPDLIVKEAAQFMERNKERPFFIYFAMNNPHYPYQPEPKWLDHYKDLPYPRNLYAAFVSTLDERIGALLKHVDQLGLREKTIIIFQSDHGHSTEERAHFGGGSAGPYRGAKFSLFEGGIRVPAIISWPGHLPENVVREQMAHGCDWLPTITELCGAKLLNADIDGKSLVDVAKSSQATSPHPVLHWYMGPEKDPQWAVREGDWKLIGSPRDTTHGEEKAKIALAEEDKKFFLANLRADPAERHNFAKKEPEMLAHLQQLHTNWVAVAKPAELVKEPSSRENFTLGSKGGDEREIAGLKLCWCPPGRFRMGSPSGEPNRRPDEAQVEATLTRGFWMGKYEVTQGQWRRVVGEFPGQRTAIAGEGDDFPVYWVNFVQAETFCRNLTEMAQKSGELPAEWAFRIPTEAQWEYACRAGTTSATSFGNTLNRKQANFAGKPYALADGPDAGPSLHCATKVGNYPANAWGLHDMHGNEFEWCRDWYHSKLPGGVDPDLYSVKGTRNGDGTYSRVRRGGAWGDDGWACRSALRLRYEPHRGADHIGFRVVAVRL